MRSASDSTAVFIVFAIVATLTSPGLGPMAKALDTDVGAVDPVCELAPEWDILVHCREAWRMRYNHETEFLDDLEGDFTNALVLSPDGERVFALGRDWGGASYWDGPIIAIDPQDGEPIWVHRQSTPGYDTYYAGVVSSDGAILYVTGFEDCDPCALLIQAIDTATGDVLWTSSEPGQGLGYDIVLDEARNQVYLTALFAEPHGQGSTQAHDATTGERLWRADLGGEDLSLTPDGSVLVVTGIRADGAEVTVGLDPTTGLPLWEGTGSATEIVVAPDGSRVYQAATIGPSGAEDMSVSALDPTTGDTIWHRVLDGPAGSVDDAAAIALSPDGTDLVVTGRSFSSHEQPGDLHVYDQDAWTLSMDPGTGEILWEDRFDGGYRQADVPWDVKFAPDGSSIYIVSLNTGPTAGVAVTRALDPETGQTEWEARTDGVWDSMVAFSGETLQVAPDGSMVTIGISSMSSDWFDLTVIAYRTGT